MNRISFDSSRCIRDGLCAEVCPRKLIRIDAETGIPSLLPSTADQCIACGHCLAVCPSAAVTLNGTRPEDCAVSDTALIPRFEELGQLLKSRRSIRVFRDGSVSRDLIARILDACRYAPSASNSQPVKWILVEGKDRIRELGSLVIESMERARASWTAAETKHFDMILRAWEQGEDRIFRDAPALILNCASRSGPAPLENCIIAMAYFELAAAASGLGSCWIRYLMSAVRSFQPIKDWLGIPGDQELYGAMILGRPLHTYRRIPPRKEVIYMTIR